MSQDDKLSIFPTRMNLKIINNRLETAHKGHKLLKIKSDALNIYFKKIEKKINILNEDINSLFKNTFLLLSKAQFLGANMEFFIKDSEKYPLTLLIDSIFVSGITFFQFNAKTSFEFDEIYGKGANHFNEARIQFKKLIILFIEISSIKEIYYKLQNIIINVNRRINSLEHFLIPRLENTQKSICIELDEQDREDFFRLKKIQTINKKKI